MREFLAQEEKTQSYKQLNYTHINVMKVQNEIKLNKISWNEMK